MDEMMATMAAAEDEANRHLTPGQIRLRDNVDQVNYWAQVVLDWDMVIYAETPTVATIAEGSDFDVKDNRERGYLTGTAYSTAEPDGEFGDTHVSQVIPIDKDTFDLARLLGWPSYSALREPDNQMLARMLSVNEHAMHA
jgi:hypothetical protein